jgi:hypothetical protein
MLVLAAGGSASAECLASLREIKFADGSAQVKNYVCKSEGAAKPEIRVEFDRLSEAAAGSLIQGSPYPELEKAFGTVRVVQNDVAMEAKKLFDSYGVKSTEESCFAFAVNSGEGGKSYDTGETQPCGQRTLWYLTFPDQEALTTMPMPLPADVRSYQERNDWPPGYAFFYKGNEYCEQASLILCTMIWRLARQDDIANYTANEAEYDKLLGLEVSTPEEAAAAEDDPSSYQYGRKRYFGLIDYLTAAGWPRDFMVVSGAPSECGGGINFELHIRQMTLDVAFVQNLSGKPLRLDAVLGSAGGGQALRPIQPGAQAGSGKIALPAGTLKPGETVAVPLAISFPIASSLDRQFHDEKAAAATYKKIQKAPGTTLELKDEGAEEPIVIRKTKASFASPTVPRPATYAFGPELRLSGLVLDGKPILFDQAARNFMELTAGEGYGSCPYLYAYDDWAEVWVRHGKVIDAADKKEKETTETLAFDGFRARFRLAEEELEVSYIDSVKLEVELKDGRGMSLAPDHAKMRAKDGHYATIKAGERIEFSFALPAEVKPEDVSRSRLAITGYYRQYSSMMTARR